MSGNIRPQSAQLAEPLRTDPGIKNVISVRELLISTLKKKRRRGIIIIIITYIYNALNDALSASRIHNKLKTILSKYIHIQNRQF